MIVKNEESGLDRCLSSIRDYVDEIIITDTGSTDKTKEIALRYTDKVFDFPWVNDFAAARNYSISKAMNEFILVIDGDELLESIDIMQLKKSVADNPGKIGRLLRIDGFTRNDNFYKSSERISRLFSKRYYCYKGMIHEQITLISGEASDAVANTYSVPLTISHLGYDGDLAVRRKKTERNITLLKESLKENQEDPYIYYQLGKSCYMEEDYVNACNNFEKALAFDLNPKLEYVQDMVESYGYTLINTSQYSKAMQLLNIYDEFAQSADFTFVIALILMNNGKFDQAINEFKKTAKKSECKIEGVNSFLAFYNIAIIYDCLGDRQHALDYYRKCGNYAPALNRLKIIEIDKI